MQHPSTLEIREPHAQPISEIRGILVSISGARAAWMSACWPNE
jgi:hypothetical protein